MSLLPEIKTAVEEMSEAQQLFVQTQTQKLDGMKVDNDALRERVEELESRRHSPGRAPLSGEAAQSRDGIKTYFTESGPVYELAHDVKLEDALPRPAKAPEIPFERWLAATLLGERCQDKAALAFAREKKQMVTTTTGVLIPTEYQSQWIDLIRAQSVLNAAGMRTATMDAKTQTHSAVTADPAVTWHTEAGSINVGNPTFAARQLIAKTAVVRCQGSLELAQDSPNFGAQLAAVMTRAMGAAIDAAGLVGVGTAEPQGIYGTSGVNTVTAVGVMSDFSKLLTGVQKLLDANVPLDVAVANILMCPKTWLRLENLVTGISSDKTQLPRPRALESSAFRVTTAIPSSMGSPDTTLMFLGDFRDLLLGVRQESAVEALKLTTFASNLLIEYIGYTRVDFLVARPASFVVLSGITP